MAEYIESVSTQTSKLDWAFPFQRTGAFPIDRSILFSSLADATAYASGDGSDERGLGGTSYVGQIISVYETPTTEEGVATVNAYIISPARSLMKLASTTTSGDVTADIAALQGQVSSILSDIEALEEALGKVYTKTEADTAFATKEENKEVQNSVDELADRVTANEGAIDLLNAGAETIGSVDYKIAQQFATLVENPDEAMNSINELVTWANDHADDALELSNKVSTNEQNIGTIQTRLNGIDEGAQVNVIDAVDESQFAIGDGKLLTLLDIAMDKVTGLSDALNGKVNTETGKSLIEDTLITKLQGIETGAQVNYIKTVDGNQFNVDPTTGNLTLLDVAISKVDGLQSALDGKVDKEEGSRLINSDEIAKLAKLVIDEETGDVGLSGTISAENVVGLDEMLEKKVTAEEGKSLVADTEIEKLASVEAGAEVNVIEGIKIAGTLLELADKIADVPLATVEAAGVVKSSAAENKIAVGTDGTMEVNNLNVNKLVQSEGEFLILDGGNSSN